ncbi:hypothetical protein A8713_26790 [Streptomyces sp. SAT1]|nr:hypothetical protein A8713_26790 [Streptomyces sp. SAT1]
MVPYRPYSGRYGTVPGVVAHGRDLGGGPEGAFPRTCCADGRSIAALGLSITEGAALARVLGLRDAAGLDGGGSTTTAVGGAVLDDPSDAAGERPVDDALLILPRRD